MDAENEKLKVNSEYARSKVEGQSKSFGSWVKQVHAELESRDPRLVEGLDLSKVRVCDRLHQHFDLDKQNPEQAAVAIQAELAKNPEYLHL